MSSSRTTHAQRSRPVTGRARPWGRAFTSLLLLLGMLSVSSTAHANTPEDMMGLGARVTAMGGAGTALSEDFSAVYYNPARLTRCANNAFSFGLRNFHHSSSFVGALDAPPLEEPDEHTRVSLGLCNELAYGLRLGFALALGLQNPMTFDQTGLNEEPQFLLYGEPLEQLSIIAGLGYPLPFVDGLSVGLGMSVLVNSGLGIDARVAVLNEEAETGTEVSWELEPRAAFYISLDYQPGEQLQMGLTYRSPLYHQLLAPASVYGDVAGLPIPIELLIESTAWYSPQQLSLGGAVDFRERWTLAADLSWYDWSSYPGPFVQTSAAREDSLSAAIRFPESEAIDIEDTWTARVGMEYRMLEPRFALRGGLSFRPSAMPDPVGVANLLDNDTLQMSVGAGFDWGPVRGTPGLDASKDHSNGRVDVVLRWSQMFERTVRKPALPSSETAPQEQPTTGTEEIMDAPTMELEHRQYTYGMAILEAGVTLTLGWF